MNDALGGRKRDLETISDQATMCLSQVLRVPTLGPLRYIADGISPLLDAPVVEQSFVAHSPDRSKFKEYLKPRGHLAAPVYMPHWDMEELEILRAGLYSNSITPEQVSAACIIL